MEAGETSSVPIRRRKEGLIGLLLVHPSNWVTVAAALTAMLAYSTRTHKFKEPAHTAVSLIMLQIILDPCQLGGAGGEPHGDTLNDGASE